MTRKDAIKILSELAGYEKTMDLIQNYSVSVQDALHIAINSLEIDERYELEYEQAEPKTDVLDKIRAEIIDKYMTATGEVNTVAKGCLQIIDKYKAESEVKE